MPNTARKSKNRSKRRSRGPVQGEPIKGFPVQRTLFPIEYRGTLVYSGYLALTPSAGAVSDQVYRLNSIYDPDYSGTGITVMGYTQVNALYQRYRVLSAKATVQWDNLSSDPATAFLVASPNPTISANINYIQSQRISWTSPISGKGGPTKSHVVSLPIHKVFGVPALQVKTEHDFAASLGANPANSVYLHAGIYQNGASAGNCNLFVKIEYHVVLSMPYDLST